MIDEIVESVRKQVTKQNPWMPYRGDAGGEGWQNLITGEVRYQDQRPSPQEGTPDDYEGEVPEPSDEVPEEIDSFDPENVTVEDYKEYLEEGMVVTTEIGDSQYQGEIQEIDGEDIWIDDPSMSGDAPFSMTEIVDHPSELAPPQGWADGWAGAPDHFTDLESDQRFEVYDSEAGEYHMAEVNTIKPDDSALGSYMAFETEEGELYEIAEGGDVEAGQEFIITAQEDPDLLGPQPVDVEDLQPGDSLLIQGDPSEGEVVHNFYDMYSTASVIEDNPVPVRVLDTTDSGGLKFRSQQTLETGYLSSGNVHSDRFSLTAEQGEETALDAVPGIDPSDTSDTNWDIITHAEATIETPAGEVEGPVNFIREGGQGYNWYSVGEGEDAETFTTNPDSPLYAGEVVQQVEDPWTNTFTDMELSVGDKVEMDGRVLEVNQVNEDAGILLSNGEWYSSDSAVHNEADSVLLSEMPEPPAESPDNSWNDAVDYDSGGDFAGFEPIPEDTYIAYYDAKSGENKVGQAKYFSQDDTVELQNGEEVSRDQMQGFAYDEMQNVVDPGDLSVGEQITVAEGADTITGTVSDTGGGTAPQITVVDENLNATKVRPTQPGVAIQEYNPDEGVFNGEAFERGPGGTVQSEVPTDDIVGDIKEHVDFSHRDTSRSSQLHKELQKDEKDKLQNAFYKYFGVEAVENYYDMVGDWKTASGSAAAAETLARSYRRAEGIQAQARDNHGRDPTREEVKLADTISSISSYYFEEEFGESQELARGSSAIAWESFVDQFLSEPTNDEFRLSFLANNNHTTDFRDTADRWNNFTVQHEVEADDVLTMTDHLFRTSYESEYEIGVSGDGQTTKLDGVRPGPTGYGTRNRPMTSDIENWDEELTENFWWSMQDSSVNYDDMSGGQLQNLKRTVDAFDSNVDTGTVSQVIENEVDEARKTLINNGYPPEEDDDRNQFPAEEFEGLGEVTYDNEEGVDAKIETEFDGVVQAEIMGTEDGDIIAWDNSGDGTADEYVVEPSDILGLNEDQLEDLQEDVMLPEPDELKEQYSPDPTEFDTLEDIYFSVGGEIREGRVLEVNEDEEWVEIKNDIGLTEKFSFSEVNNGTIVSQEQVREDYLEPTEVINEDFDLDDVSAGDKVYLDEGDDPYDVVATDDFTGEVIIEGNNGLEHAFDPEQFYGVVEETKPPAPPSGAESDENTITVDDWDAVETEAVDPNDYGNTFSEGDDVLVEFSSIGETREGTVDTAEGAQVVVDTDEGKKFLHHGTPHKEVKIPVDAGESGTEDGAGGTDETEASDGTDAVPEDAYTPIDMANEQLGMGEEITIEDPPGKVEEFVVEDPGDTYNSPVEVRSQETGDIYLVWPDGDMEQM